MTKSDSHFSELNFATPLLPHECSNCGVVGGTVLILRDDLTVVYNSTYDQASCKRFSSKDSLLQENGKVALDCEVPSSPLLSLCLLENCEEARTAFSQAFASGQQTHTFQFSCKSSRGISHQFKWTILRLESYEGSPAWLAIGRDISLQHEASVANQTREAILHAILDTVVDGAIIINQEGVLESINPAALRMFGYASQELIGKNVSLLMPPPHRDEHDHYIARYLHTGDKRIIGIGREVEGLRKDGSTFPIDLAVSESRIGDRRLFTGILRDISQRKATQRKLLQSERLAAIGQMVTGLAHESRNAFQRSQACLELLELEIEDRPEAVELIHRIQRAQDHIYNLYDEVRNFAAPLNMRMESCDLSILLKRTWRHLEKHWTEKDVVLKTDFDENATTCHADPERLEQIIRNILENAIYACYEPGIITVTSHPTTLDGEKAVHLSIRDNGPGLTREAANHIFDPFFTTKVKGTGLGMAITRRIVEAHRGTIHISPPSKKGVEDSTKFTLRSKQPEPSQSRLTSSTDRPSAPGPGAEVVLTLLQNAPVLK